jgi:F-type H+-transporting ATPase subunit alpha
MKKVSGSLKLAYSQFRELQAFSQFGSDLDEDTKNRLSMGERIVEVLKQDRNAPVPVEQQVCIIYAVTKGWLREIPVDRISDYEAKLFRFMQEEKVEILQSIQDTGDLTAENEELLKKALTLFNQRYLAEN